MTIRLFAVTLLCIPLFAFSQSNSNDRDIVDINGNGIRDDVDRIITIASDDALEADQLRFYAFFLSRFVETEGVKLAQSFVKMVDYRNCIDNEETLIDIKARILDSEYLFTSFIKANSVVADYTWLNSFEFIDNCQQTLIQNSADYWSVIQAVYEEDICNRIKNNSQFTIDPIAKIDYQACLTEFTEN